MRKFGWVVVIVTALAVPGCNWTGCCDREEAAVTDRVTANATLRVIDAATPVVVDKAAKEVVAKTVPEVSEKVFKATVPAVVAEATKQAVPKVIEASIPPVVAESIKQVVPIAVPLVVKEAIPLTVAAAVPLVVAQADCCPEKAAQAQLKATGVITGGGGSSSSEHYHHTGSIGTMAPAVVVEDTRISNPDLPPRMVDGERLLTPRCGGGMGPQLLPQGALVTFDGERVHITGVAPVKVEVYTPRSRTLNGACDFGAANGERFNFTFRCAKGHEHYALLTDNMAAFLPEFFGQGIGLDNTDCCGSTFITQ